MISEKRDYLPPEEAQVSHRRSEIRHKTEVISVRCTAEEKAEIAAWAAAQRMTVSQAMLLCQRMVQRLDEREQEAMSPPTDDALDDERDYGDDDRHRAYDASFPEPAGADQW